MKNLLASIALTLAFACSVPLAVAPAAAAPRGTAAAPKPPSPSSYKYVVEKDDDEETMHVDGFATSDDQNFIRYTLRSDTNQVHIEKVMGVKDTPGVGEALKKELLRRHPSKVVTAVLVDKNRETLLAAWAKSYPSAASDDELRKVPAMKFDGYDYVVTADPSNTGHSGRILLKMTPKDGAATVTVANPKGLDQVLLASDQRPKTKTPPEKHR